MVRIMSALQYELIRATSGLSDTSMEKVIDYVRTFIVPFDRYAKAANSTADSKAKRELGTLAGEKFLSDGYDFDEANDEIAEMFGVREA